MKGAEPLGPRLLRDGPNAGKLTGRFWADCAPFWGNLSCEAGRAVS